MTEHRSSGCVYMCLKRGSRGEPKGGGDEINKNRKALKERKTREKAAFFGEKERRGQLQDEKRKIQS